MAIAEKQGFISALGAMCPCLSDTMLEKCWREIAAYEGEHRTIMIDAMLAFALDRANRRKARR